MILEFRFVKLSAKKILKVKAKLVRAWIEATFSFKLFGMSVVGLAVVGLLSECNGSDVVFYGIFLTINC